MGMAKVRKPKRYADGGPVSYFDATKKISIPGEDYKSGVDPEHIYFMRPSQPVASSTSAVPMNLNDTQPDLGGGGDGGGGDGGGGGGGGDGGGGYAKGGAVKTKKMVSGGVVKSKMGRGDGCAMRGKTKGTMR